MAANLIFAPEVEFDIQEAYDWYEKRRAGLGEEFVSCLSACYERICRSPELHAIIHENYRRAKLRRFPYLVFYEYTENTDTIYCVFHTARDPSKWRERLP
jgi:plasmid stabilization system protein ParE